MLKNKVKPKKGFCYVSCVNLETRKREHFKVAESVYVYIRQLEHETVRREETLDA